QALALAIDVSGSVDPREFGIQMDGLAAALRDGLVSEALVRAEAAVLVVQWTGSSRQAVSVNWTRTRTFEEVEALAAKVEAVTRKWRNFSTAIGEALEFTLAQFPLGPDCARRVIDVSGDGLSNEGVEPTSVHDRLAVENVVVNGLAIEGLGGDLTAYYFENVIRGEGAFVMTATGYLDYPETIRRKLIREVTRQIASVK
ncbi:MAG: DUF1194 domain-containing protein, partial [Pseudomonadota bacterium]